jgi:hypothetical protein
LSDTDIQVWHASCPDLTKAEVNLDGNPWRHLNFDINGTQYGCVAPSDELKHSIGLTVLDARYAFGRSHSKVHFCCGAWDQFYHPDVTVNHDSFDWIRCHYAISIPHFTTASDLERNDA